MKRVLFCTHKLSPFHKTIPWSLRQLGFTVSIFDYYQPTVVTQLVGAASNFFHFDRDNHYLNRLVNDALLQQVIRQKPDYFLTTKALNITNETIEKINALGTTTINWFQDLLEFLPWLKEHAASYKFLFTPDPFMVKEMKKIGIRSYFLPLATIADSNIGQVKKVHNIVFIGQYTQRREKLFYPLKRFGKKFQIWGYKKWKTSRLSDHYHGFLPTTEAVLDVLRKSRIVVNVQTAEEDYPTDVVNLRVFETTGVGTFLLNWHHSSIDEFFKDGQEIVNFTSANDLYTQVKYYLHHEQEREQIAKAGWLRTKRDHTYTMRLQDMFSIVTS